MMEKVDGNRVNYCMPKTGKVFRCAAAGKKRARAGGLCTPILHTLHLTRRFEKLCSSIVDSIDRIR